MLLAGDDDQVWTQIKAYIRGESIFFYNLRIYFLLQLVLNKILYSLIQYKFNHIIAETWL